MIENDTKSFEFLFHRTMVFEVDYNRYVFFAISSILIGLPANILLLAILIKNKYSRSQRINGQQISTGSFERFLFEIVLIDTVLLLYHFLDNFFSYIRQDRSTGAHYLIHVSDFCCKFFSYFSKMSVLLTTWLLVFLTFNQLILTMKSNRSYPYWKRCLNYINAKYSTVFLIFFFSVYNIYPIEVLKYQKKEDLQDYQQDGVSGVCAIVIDETNINLLNTMNYVYNLLGISIPSLIILPVSFLILIRNDTSKRSFPYIAAVIGIFHSLFNLPSRISDILLMFLSPYSSFYSFLIQFNHESGSVLFLSYAYKCFVCIIISRRYRSHGKALLCFLIENRSPSQQFARRSCRPQLINRYNMQARSEQYSVILSERIYWIRPYFTQKKRRTLLRPYGRSESYH